MAEIEELDDDGKEAKSTYDAPYWHEQLTQYRTQVEDKWKTQRENLDRLYARYERADSADREYSIFWANVEVLKPAVYSRAPVPVVAPRFKGSDPLASSASELLERSLVTTFEQSDIDGCLKEVRDEFLRYARGTARVRLASKKDGTPNVEYDHFTAADFAHDANARTWREVKWVGFRAWLSLDQGLKRFGEIFSEVPRKKRDTNAVMAQRDDQAPVWEIWCQSTGMVHFIAEDFDKVLDEIAPWVDLSGFWPCPRPAYGTVVPGKIQPVPDILQYKDQIEEINEYTARISALSEKLRLKGFYPAGMGELSEAIEAAMKSSDNRAELVPVSSFAALGGTSFKDSIVWLPLTDVLELIKGLVELRRVIIEDVYQITGISDIVRGQTQASETATAQQIKAQWGSIRIRERQNEIARFARDLTRISGEIIAENFDPQTIMQMAQMPQDDPQVFAFLKNDKARGFVIEVETDSTIQPDEDAEKQRRIEFVGAIGQLMEKAFPVVQAAPMLGPFMGEVLKFTAQGFRAGRPLEGAIDQLVQVLGGMAQQAMQPKPPPKPDPTEVVKAKTAEIKGQAETMRAQVGMAQTQMDMQRSVLEHEQAMQRMAAEAAMPMKGMSQ